VPASNGVGAVPCVINAYTATVPTQEALVRKLVGEEAFVGFNPVDPFFDIVVARYQA